MNDDWCYALDAVADEVLENAGFLEPPVDAFDLADRLQMTVAVDDSQTMRGRLKTLNGSPAAFLRPDDRPERLQWALAHEIGEAMAWRVAERTDDVVTISPGQREEIANQLASRFLLPGRWFFPDANNCSDNLNVLKQRYPAASYALLALRLLDRRAVPMIITIADQGRISCRKSNISPTPPAILEEERAAIGESHETGQPACRQFPDYAVHVWPIHEPHWKREIAVMTFTNDPAFAE